MPPPIAPTATTARPARRRRHDTVARVRGHWLVLARAGWLTAALLAGAFFVASLPAFYHQLITFRDPAMQHADAVRAGVAQLGLPVTAYAVSAFALRTALALTYAVIGAAIFWRRSGEQAPLVVSLTLVVFGAFISNTTPELVTRHPVWDFIARALGWYGWNSFFVLLYLFPDGRFVPGWTRPFAIGFMALGLLDGFFPGSALDPGAWLPVLSLAGMLVFVWTIIFA